jgi:hypothetical protein
MAPALGLLLDLLTSLRREHAQFSFCVAGTAVRVGAAGFLLAWNRHDSSPSAIDNPALTGIGLYSIMAPTTGTQLVKAMLKQPLPIPKAGCPEYPDGFSINGSRDLVTQFSVKPGTALGPFVDVKLDLYEGSQKIYRAAVEGQMLKAELADNSLLHTKVSFFDRIVLQAWEDSLEGWANLLGGDLPAKTIWATMLTPGEKVAWW